MIANPTQQRTLENRRRFVLFVLLLATLGLVARAAQLQLIDKDFLQGEGNARHERVVSVPAYRGMILDRQGEPLAVSTPVSSIWVDPTELVQARLPQLAQALGHNSTASLEQTLTNGMAAGRRFSYVRRRLEPNAAQAILDLDIPGVYAQTEYQRFYPDAEVSAHVIGFTNIDDVGQEGLERTFDTVLRGELGSKRVVRDSRGRVMEELENLRDPQPGRDLNLSIDRRLQYYTYKALMRAVSKHRAESGSAVMVDVSNGEILALVNQPSANPNNGSERKLALLRNRVATDVFEPGSTLKPFPIALALEKKLFGPQTIINTRPGYMRVGRNLVRDHRNYGRLSVAEVISKSSNVGVTKIALTMSPQSLWRLYRDLGFGQATGMGLAGESAGVLRSHKRWNEFAHATHAFGYGLSTTLLQLAQAYSVLAADGVRRPLSLLRLEEIAPGQRLLSAATVRKVRAMLEQVVSDKGTARKAAVLGYRVAGKTGTVRKVINGKYAKDRYLSLFAGMVPASQPRLVMVVMIDDPKGKEFYGGLVAAPVFSEAMGHALRLLNVLPDDIGSLTTAKVD